MGKGNLGDPTNNVTTHHKPPYAGGVHTIYHPSYTGAIPRVAKSCCESFTLIN